MKTALITGITGQDGSFLAGFFLHKGYEVHGIVRRAIPINRIWIDYIHQDPHLPRAPLSLHYGDLSDTEQVFSLIFNLKLDEIYHFGVSFEFPEYKGNITSRFSFSCPQ